MSKYLGVIRLLITIEIIVIITDFIAAQFRQVAPDVMSSFAFTDVVYVFGAFISLYPLFFLLCLICLFLWKFKRSNSGLNLAFSIPTMVLGLWGSFIITVMTFASSVWK